MSKLYGLDVLPGGLTDEELGALTLAMEEEDEDEEIFVVELTDDEDFVMYSPQYDMNNEPDAPEVVVPFAEADPVSVD